jgi:hypothetical protein
MRKSNINNPRYFVEETLRMEREENSSIEVDKHQVDLSITRIRSDVILIIYQLAKVEGHLRWIKYSLFVCVLILGSIADKLVH